MSSRDPEITRKCILDAALKLFAERGFHGTNVPDVATEASVGAGSIYRHFADKIALVNVLYRDWKERFRDSILNPPPAEGMSFQAQFMEYWARLWRFYRTYPAALIFLDVHAHGNYLHEDSRMVAREFERDLSDWIAAGQENNAIVQEEPSVLIAMVYGAFLGLVKLENANEEVSADSMIRSGDRAWALISP